MIRQVHKMLRIYRARFHQGKNSRFSSSANSTKVPVLLGAAGFGLGRKEKPKEKVEAVWID